MRFRRPAWGVGGEVDECVGRLLRRYEVARADGIGEALAHVLGVEGLCGSSIMLDDSNVSGELRVLKGSIDPPGEVAARKVVVERLSIGTAELTDEFGEVRGARRLCSSFRRVEVEALVLRELGAHVLAAMPGVTGPTDRRGEVTMPAVQGKRGPRRGFGSLSLTDSVFRDRDGDVDQRAHLLGQGL